MTPSPAESTETWTPGEGGGPYYEGLVGGRRVAMESVGQLSLRDDVDYSRPIAARMYSQTTLDSTHSDQGGAERDREREREGPYATGEHLVHVHEPPPTHLYQHQLAEVIAEAEPGTAS